MLFLLRVFMPFIFIFSKLAHCSIKSNNTYSIKCKKISAVSGDDFSFVLVNDGSLFDEKFVEATEKELLKSIVEVDASKCGLTNFSLQSLKESFCAPHTSFCSLNFGFLETINISLNFLTSFDLDIPLPRLRLLDLSDNLIPVLPFKSFEQSPNLQYLDLSNNLLEFLDESSFNDLKNIQTLLINNQNNLLKIHDNTFDSLVSLRRLSISKCPNLRELPQDVFKNNENLIFLDLQGNTLSNLSFLSSLNTTSLQLLLGGNQFNCDCNDLKNIEKLKHQTNIQGFKCENIPQNKSIPITNIIKSLSLQCFNQFENSRKTSEITLKLNSQGLIPCGINSYLITTYKYLSLNDTSQHQNGGDVTTNSIYIRGKVTWYIKRNRMKLSREIHLRDRGEVDTNEEYGINTPLIFEDNATTEGNFTVLNDGSLYIPSVKSNTTGTYLCDFEILSVNHQPLHTTSQDQTEKTQPEFIAYNNDDPTLRNIYLTQKHLTPPQNFTSMIIVRLDYSSLHNAVYDSILVGVVTVAFIFVLSVILGASRYLFNTCNRRAKAKKQDIVEVIEKLNGFKCAQVDKFLAYRNVQLDRLFAFTSATKDHLFAFRVSKIDKLRTHKQCTITSILHQLDRMKVHYIVQSSKVKDNCGQQVEKLRESYEFGRGKLRKYGSERVEKVRETYNCQVCRVKEYGTDQMRRLRLQYKAQQQCLLKLMQLINAGHCASVIEEDCRKTESEIFDEEVQVFLDEGGVVAESDGDEDVFEDDEVEMELARSISEIERICNEGIQKSEEHFVESMHLSCDCSVSSVESVVDCNYISPPSRKKRNKNYNNEKHTATSAEITSLNESQNFLPFYDLSNNCKCRPLSFDNSASPSSEHQKSFTSRKIKSLQLNDPNKKQSPSINLLPFDST